MRAPELTEKEKVERMQQMLMSGEGSWLVENTPMGLTIKARDIIHSQKFFTDYLNATPIPQFRQKEYFFSLDEQNPENIFELEVQMKYTLEFDKFCAKLACKHGTIKEILQGETKIKKRQLTQLERINHHYKLRYYLLQSNQDISHELENYFGEELKSPVSINHMDNILINIKYAKVSHDNVPEELDGVNGIEYAGLGRLGQNSSRNIILAHIPFLMDLETCFKDLPEK